MTFSGALDQRAVLLPGMIVFTDVFHSLPAFIGVPGADLTAPAGGPLDLRRRLLVLER